jgi:hypothetical protein
MKSMILLLSAGPGEKLQETVGHELGSLFLLAVIGISLWFFLQRKFTQFIGFALFSMLISVFIFSPWLISQMGTDAFRWLFENWLN